MPLGLMIHKRKTGSGEVQKKRSLYQNRDFPKFLLGLYVMSLGVVLSVKSDMGTSPISSLPLVITLSTGLSLGTTLMVVHSIFIIIQCFIVRSRRAFLLTVSQVPVTLGLSVFTDINTALLNWFEPEGILWELGLMALSSVTIGLGIAWEIDSNVSMVADDGLVWRLHLITGVKINTIITTFYTLFVSVAIVLSYLEFGSILGVGVGTVFLALTVGIFTQFFQNHDHIRAR